MLLYDVRARMGLLSNQGYGGNAQTMNTTPLVKKSKRAIAITGIALSALVLAACGDDDAEEVATEVVEEIEETTDEVIDEATEEVTDEADDIVATPPDEIGATPADEVGATPVPAEGATPADEAGVVPADADNGTPAASEGATPADEATDAEGLVVEAATPFASPVAVGATPED